MCVCVCVCVCFYQFISKEKERQTDRVKYKQPEINRFLNNWVFKMCYL